MCTLLFTIVQVLAINSYLGDKGSHLMFEKDGEGRKPNAVAGGFEQGKAMMEYLVVLKAASKPISALFGINGTAKKQH